LKKKAEKPVVHKPQAEKQHQGKPAKPAKKKSQHAKEKASKPEFLPVTYEEKNEEKKTQLPINSMKDIKITDPTKIASGHLGDVVLTQREGDKSVIFYVRPSDFEKYVVTQKLTPKDAERVRQEVLKNLRDFRQSWVKFGAAILSVHVPRLYLAWGFKSFPDYCEQELKLHFSTLYQIMASTLFLMKNQPEFYRELMAGKAEAYENLPSYHALYLLDKKRKCLEDKGKFDDLQEQLLKKGLSTRDLAKKLHEILGESKPSLTVLVSRFAALCKQMPKLQVPQDVVKEAFVLLGKLKGLKEAK
jgi:hypothetical protein